MSRGKKLLGLLMAVGLSVGMSVTPVLAETTSILDTVSEEELTEEETTEDLQRIRNIILQEVQILIVEM